LFLDPGCHLEELNPICFPGGLTEPIIVPRFLEALKDAGAYPTRVPAYLTTLGARKADVVKEMEMLMRGAVSAIVLTSTAEVRGLVLGRN
jgi:uroporphyrinogen-III synthase